MATIIGSNVAAAGQDIPAPRDEFQESYDTYENTKGWFKSSKKKTHESKRISNMKRHKTKSKSQSGDAEEDAQNSDDEDRADSFESEVSSLPGNSDVDNLTEKLTQLATHFENLPGLSRRIEGFVLMLVSLRDCQSHRQFCSITLSFFSTCFDEGICSTLLLYLKKHGIAEGLDSQAGTSDPIFVRTLRYIGKNWRHLRNSEAAQKIHRVATLFCAAGFCEAKSITPTIGGLELFHIKASKHTADALTLADAVLDTVVYLIEGAWMVLKTGNAKYFLYSNAEIVALETRFYRLVSWDDNRKLGSNVHDKDLGRIPTMEDIDVEFRDLTDDLKMLRGPLMNSTEGQFINSSLAWLQRSYSDFSSSYLRKTVREAPYGMKLYGDTSVGKSTLWPLLNATVLKANGYDPNPKKVVIRNGFSQFWDTNENDTQTIVYDDACNTNLTYAEGHVAMDAIKTNNNTVEMPNMAELSKKGNIFFNHKVEVVTTNVCDLESTLISNCPLSVLRRFRLHITMTVKHEFRKPMSHMLDPTKVHRAYANEEGVLPAIMDLWWFDVEEAVPNQSEPGKNAPRQGGSKFKYQYHTHDGMKLQRIGIETLLDFLAEDSVKWFEIQKSIVKSSANFSKSLVFCDPCKRPKAICKCSDGASCASHTSDLTSLTLERQFGALGIDTATVEKVTQDMEALGGQDPDPIVIRERMAEPDVKVDSLKGIGIARIPPARLKIAEKWMEHELRVLPPLRDELEPPHEEFAPENPDSLTDNEYIQLEHHKDRRMGRSPRTDLEILRIKPARPPTAFGRPNTRFNVQPSGRPKRDSQSLFSIVTDYQVTRGRQFFSRVAPAAVNSFLGYNAVGCNVLEKFLMDIWSSPVCNFLNWIPDEWTESSYVKNAVYFMQSDKVKEFVLMYSICYILIFCLSIIVLLRAFFDGAFYLHLFVCLVLWAYLYIGLCTITKDAKRAVFNRFIRTRQSFVPFFKNVRTNYAKHTLYGLGGLFSVYLIYVTTKSLWNTHKPQGKLDPTTAEEVKERDDEGNCWEAPKITPIPRFDSTKTMTSDQLVQKVSKNLVHVTLSLNGQSVRVCDGVMVTGNCMLLPTHVLDGSDTFNASVVRHEVGTSGGNFDSIIDAQYWATIPNLDLTLVYIPGGGSYASLIPYLPDRAFCAFMGKSIWRSKEGELTTFDVVCKDRALSTIHTSSTKFTGLNVIYSINTYSGLCMAPAIANGKSPIIAGFHLSGRANTPRGNIAQLDREKVEAAIAKIKSFDGTMVSSQQGTLRTTILGVSYFKGDEVHAKSPIRYMEPGTNYAIYGSVTGRNQYHSEVVTTPISPHVTQVFGVPQLWGGPKFNRPSWRPWQESLTHSSRPSTGVPGSLLARAVTDYKSVLIHRLDAPKCNWKQEIFPLPWLNTINGWNGRRFVDSIPRGTSLGFPLSGAKRDRMIAVEEEIDTIEEPYDFDSEIREEVQFCLEEYKAGRQCHHIFKACLKDEPTSLAKDKVRVFQAAPVALQICTRMYFLPICRFLSMNPIISECAVGINAHSQEWDELHRHINKYGSDRILAGDYSKYDLRMPAQLTLAAFRVLMDLGRHCGYSDEDITIMEGVATDICYPFTAFNGDLIQFFGSNPSGQTCTVYVNSIVNSLLLRCAFYEHPGQWDLDFRSQCALSTYGDDCKGSVSESCKYFNHLIVADFLSRHDMKFTMPDKKSTPTAFMSDADCDFLKRKSVYHEALGVYLGALDDMSILKSLHAVVKSPHVDLLGQCQMNISGALREWFAHGPTVYEQQRARLSEVARLSNLYLACQDDLEKTYEHRVFDWLFKYDPAKVENTSDMTQNCTSDTTQKGPSVSSMDVIVEESTPVMDTEFTDSGLPTCGGPGQEGSGACHLSSTVVKVEQCQEQYDDDPPDTINKLSSLVT